MSPKRLGGIAGFVAAVIITWLLTRPTRLERADSPLKPLEPPAVEQPAPAPHGPNTAPRHSGQAPPNALAMRLNDPASSPSDDLEIVHTLLVLMRDAARGRSSPMGLNEEFTAALTGDNPDGLPFIPPDHPAINEAGQLIDRWGRPYHFHPLAMDRVEIRSAGPDGKPFSGDDVVFAPWGRGEE